MPDSILVFGREPRKEIGFATLLHGSIICVWILHTKVSNYFLQVTNADIDISKIKRASSP